MRRADLNECLASVPTLKDVAAAPYLHVYVALCWPMFLGKLGNTFAIHEAI